MSEEWEEYEKLEEGKNVSGEIRKLFLKSLKNRKQNTKVIRLRAIQRLHANGLDHSETSCGVVILLQRRVEGGEKIEEVRNAPETKYNAVRPALGHEGEREEGEIQCKILIGHK